MRKMSAFFLTLGAFFLGLSVGRYSLSGISETLPLVLAAWFILVSYAMTL